MKRHSFLLSQVRPSFRFALLFALVIGTHFLAVTHMLPPSVVVDEVPLTQYDHGHDYARALRALAFQRASGRSWGYDPYHMAGYVTGSLAEAESRWATWAARIAGRPGRVPQALKAAVFLQLWLAPLFLFFAARRFGLERNAALLAMALGASGLMSWFPMHFDFIVRGHHGFITAQFCLVYSLAALYAYTKSARPRLLVEFVLSLVAAFTFSPHPLWTAAVPTVAVLAFQLRPLSPKRLAAVLGALAAGGALLYLVSWPAPDLWGTWFAAVSSGYETHPVMLRWFVFWSGYGEHRLFGFVILILLSAAMVAPIVLFRRDRRLSLFLAATVWPVAVLAVFGSDLPVDVYRPRRFWHSWGVVSIVPAILILQRRLLPPGTVRARYALWIAWFILSWRLAAPESFPDLRRGGSLAPGTHYGVVAQAPMSGRVLFEDGIVVEALTDALPLLTGRALIGTPAPLVPHEAAFVTAFLRTSRAQPLLFMRQLHQYDTGRLLRTLHAFNVSTVVAFTTPARYAFDRRPEHFEAIETWDEVRRPPGDSPQGRAYRVRNAANSYLLKGQGRVSFDLDRLRIDNPGPPPLILKFHWADGWVGGPDVQLSPAVDRTRGGLPFISVDRYRPGRSIELSFRP